MGLKRKLIVMVLLFAFNAAACGYGEVDSGNGIEYAKILLNGVELQPGMNLSEVVTIAGCTDVPSDFYEMECDFLCFDGELYGEFSCRDGRTIEDKLSSGAWLDTGMFAFTKELSQGNVSIKAIDDNTLSLRIIGFEENHNMVFMWMEGITIGTEMSEVISVAGIGEAVDLDNDVYYEYENFAVKVLLHYSDSLRIDDICFFYR